ncbi:MAG: phenylalanine--tRNA ligase subunit beta [Muribaculaceae bacterium]|nr:phenylalanine--tRNA ligase subunit beta [Muribaculaceae bacterium]
MDISYKWLKRYIDFNYTPRELAAVFTSLGLECDNVEEVETIRGGLRGIVVGKVLTCEDHPDSDHLHITTVDLGDGQPTQIVCGAPNVAAGQTVVVATVGTTLYDGDKEFQIRKSKIRGVESFGMICAEDEIGVGTSHDGIMVLPDNVAAGTPAAEYFNVESDYRLEVELTPNRVDAASHYGCARDLKAHLWRELYANDEHAVLPEIHLPDANAFAIDCPEGGATVEILDKEGCGRYTGITIRGVRVNESPEWLRNLLIAAGQRPINNIVDITNFILLGLGQPLHCFDLDKVKGEKIEVRTCEDGTKFTTLDGVEHTLTSADMMICDAERPMALAGVFGGLDSGVTSETRNIFIESAWFNPTRVRRSARRHGLSTDASFRYERGTDPNITLFAARVAAILVQQLAGGEVCGPVVDIYDEPVNPVEVMFSLKYCADLIGKEIPQPLIMCILKALDFAVATTEDPDMLRLHVPTYRVDVTRPCDVVEEILRVYGYNNVEFGSEMHANLSVRGDVDKSYALQQSISNLLSARGFMEILNNSLSAASYYADNEVYPASTAVVLMNPLSQDLSTMRRTLLYGGLESIAHNVNRKASDLRMYEFGNVYRYDASKAEARPDKALAGYSEACHLGIWLTGAYRQGGWNQQEVAADVFQLKAIVETILRRLGISNGALKFSQDSNQLYAVRLLIESKAGKTIGELGLISRKELKRFDIDQDVAYAELNWDELYKMASKSKTEFSPLPKTQPVRRDLALLLDNGVTFAQVETAVRKAGGKMLREVRLFDVYEGKNLPEGKKSYAIAITMQDDEKTLQDRQIDAVMTKIVDALKKGLGAELR